MTHSSSAVRQLRLVVAVDDFDEAVRFYRDVLGLPEQAAFHGEGGARVAILAAGAATLEIANHAQVELIDRLETDGGRSDALRIGFEVDDAAAVTDRLRDAGAQVEASPRETPWRSLNSRLRAPGPLQVTLFQELETLAQRSARPGFRTDAADPRAARRIPEQLDDLQSAERHPEYRVDVERIRFSPYYSRLSAVTQVISQTGAGLAVHNRLTHSIKVAAVARAIATHLSNLPGEEGRIVAELGGCHPVVVQAAAAAHDLGHPPFGHLGEQTLDRLARDRFGLTEGFEGNAQTFRIITRLDEFDEPGVGLNLTAAVRAAVLKYPWLRGRGGARRGGAGKFSYYALDIDEQRAALAAYPRIETGQQTIECSVMDIADDIAYSLHDLDDFYRAGLLDQAIIAAEFRTWRAELASLRGLDPADLRAQERAPGRSLELLWRRLEQKDPWIADPDAFEEAVAKVSEEVVDGLLLQPFDGSLAAERGLARFTSAWIAHLQARVRVHRSPDIRSGHVSLDRTGWHEVAVLKFLHQRFILHRPDLAVYQRGRASVLERLVDGFAAWLDDPHDARRAPRRLVDVVELATEDYMRLRREEPELLDTDDVTQLRRLGVGRGIIDYVASLTDAQASSLDALLAGQTERLWEAGQGL